MQVSRKGKLLIKKWESCFLKAYLCPAGVWTVGWGHTGPDVKRNLTITKEQAEAFFDADVARFTAGVLKCLKTRPTQNQLDAMVGLAFNIGAGKDGFAGSTVVKRFNAGDFKGAAEAITWWNKATVDGKKVKLKGLVNRREDERALFLELDRAPITQADVERFVDLPQAVESKELKPLTLSKETIGGGLSVATGVIGVMAGLDARVQIALIIGVALVAAGTMVAGFRIWDRVRGIH